MDSSSNTRVLVHLIIPLLLVLFPRVLYSSFIYLIDLIQDYLQSQPHSRKKLYATSHDYSAPIDEANYRSMPVIAEEYGRSHMGSRGSNGLAPMPIDDRHLTYKDYLYGQRQPNKNPS